MTTPEQAIANAEATIRKITPPGFQAQFVTPPWANAPPACRGCGLTHALARPGMKWAAATITHVDKPQKVLRWSMGTFCEKCSASEAVRKRVAVDVFLPHLPPGPMPDGPAPKSH